MIKAYFANPFAILLVASLPIGCLSWLLRSTGSDSYCYSSQRRLSSTKRQIGSRPSIFFGPEEDFDCPEEDECEIDWDKMPGFSDDENPQDDLQPQESYVKQDLSLEKSRVMFEMSWQVDECNEDQDSCSDFCPDCAGSGKQHCKFCRGTGVVAYGNEFRTCLICDHGFVSCPTCKGTGRIARWAVTHDNFLSDASTF
jgi:hypothetical protein